MTMRPTVLISSIVVLMYCPVLVNQGIFWDDWTIFNMSRSGLEEEFRGAGGYYLGAFFLHYYLQQLPNPPFWYHLLSLFSSLGSALVLLKILKRFQELSLTTWVWVVVFFTVAPFFSSKVTMICLPYVICLFLFLSAFLMLIDKVDRGKGIHFRIVTLILFFLSFIVNSLLAFYIIVPLYFVYKYWTNGFSFVIRRWFRFADFMILPVLYWVLRSAYFAPTGFYTTYQYNQPSVDRLIYFPAKSAITLNETIFGVAAIFYREICPYMLFVVAIFFLFLFLKSDLLNSYFRSPDGESVRCVWLAGVFLFLIGCVPYWLVGKTPAFSGFDTRHQLILPIGFSLSLVTSIIALIRSRYRTAVCIAIAAIFFMDWCFLQKRYLSGWLKQEAIIAELNQNPIPEDFTTIEVVDLAESYNATDRSMTFYEWAGISKYVDGKEDRLFVNNELLSRLDQNQTLTEYIAFRHKNNAMEQRSMKDYFPHGTCSRMVVSPTGESLESWTTIFRLVMMYYFDNVSFRRTIGDFIRIDYAASCSQEVLKVI